MYTENYEISNTVEDENGNIIGHVLNKSYIIELIKSMKGQRLTKKRMDEIFGYINLVYMEGKQDGIDYEKYK